MAAPSSTFHRPWAFWTGCAALTAGVLAHLPMFAMAAPGGYRLAGMPMDGPMMAGMVAIPLGLALAAHGLMPRFGRLPRRGAGGPWMHDADAAPLTAAHLLLVGVLTAGIVVDVMKPATLGFVMPGLAREYGIDAQRAGLLALVALTGTAVGSVIWGRIADRAGRRGAILLSSLMFIGTAICGAMPRFEWNLAMCFLMGASAGGMLPIVFTLVAETVPARHRGWLLVALGAVGTSAGYLAAAGAAAWLEPLYSWRSLWLLGLPTGLVIVVLNRFIPESPRFLARLGLDSAADAVLARFGAATPGDTPPAAPLVRAGWQPLADGRLPGLTASLVACGIAWGLLNFGFLLWLPTSLVRMGMETATASALLAQSALLALPAAAAVVALYHGWSTVRTLIGFIVLCAAVLVAFAAVASAGIASAALVVALTALLLVAGSGVIAMLVPYAAEIYPLALRGTGTGLVAASSKLGGILGALLGVLGLYEQFALSALAIAGVLTVSAALLLRSGVETRGRRLEEIEGLVRVARAR